MNDKLPFSCSIHEIIEWNESAVLPLIENSLVEGYRNISRLADDYKEGRNRFNQPGEALFGAWIGDKLAGVCGLNIDPFASEPGVGRVRRMYVLPEYRRQGIGAKLMDAVIERAETHFHLLVLNTGDAGASTFYQSLGFAGTATIPRATHVRMLREADENAG